MGVVKVTLNSDTLIDITDTTANAGDVANGKYYYNVAGNKTQGTITSRTSTDLSASGATVTAPAGYYASSATKTIASGTEGTPTATKGVVSGNSVTVTPSVTNTAGYISGGTHTGTGVSVSASELVSGSETKTANGTYDVTNLAQLIVNVSGGGGGDSWSWAGKNPTKIQEWTEHKKFSETDFATWTWNTNQSTLYSAIALSPTLNVNVGDYDYLQINRFYVHFDYGNWTVLGAVEDFAFVGVASIFGYPRTLAYAQSETMDGNYSHSVSADNYGYFINLQGYKSYLTQTCGLYMNANYVPTASSTSTITPTVTFYRPTIYARGHTSYFTSTAFENVDMEASYYDYTSEVWRVDAQTSDKSWSRLETVKVLNSGI